MAKTNRLKLDFSLQTNIERKEFLEKYLQSEMFQKREPDEDELATMADYLLWGKDPVTGKNGKQSGLDLKSKRGTWDDSPTESLDALMEMPTFNEAALSALGSTQFRTKKETFSREEALAEASPTVRESFLNLFYEIDRIDFMIEQYELNHGKRTKEIRQSLIKQFDEEALCRMREAVTHWNQYKYLKMRHELVELRREQYTLRDSYKKIMFTQPTDDYTEHEPAEFDVNVDVLPLGLHYGEGISLQVFRAWRELDPEQIHDIDLRLISDLYWKKEQSAQSTPQTYIDFRELEHVYQLLNYLCELKDAEKEVDMSSNLSSLLRTLHFYIDHAELTDIQREILDMKLNKKKNTDIAWDINHKYGKSYTPNYISTIFRQRIIPRINEAAVLHKEIISNIFFPENFKRCSCCGVIKLRCPENFTRKSRANDGYAPRCKVCEKKARQGD